MTKQKHLTVYQGKEAKFRFFNAPHQQMMFAENSIHDYTDYLL